MTVDPAILFMCPFFIRPNYQPSELSHIKGYRKRKSCPLVNESKNGALRVP
jgi:hypothetical protein